MEGLTQQEREREREIERESTASISNNQNRVPKHLPAEAELIPVFTKG